MATLSKTQGTVALAHTEITHPGHLIGSALDISGKLGGTLTLFHGLIEAAANTNPGTFEVQHSPSASGDEDWSTIFSFTAKVGTPASENMTATEPITETSLAVAATAGFVALDRIYIQDVGTAADGEWAQVQEIVTNTSIELMHGLTNQKDSSDVIFGNAEVVVMEFSEKLGRIKVVFSHEGATGANCVVKAIMNTVDSMG